MINQPYHLNYWPHFHETWHGPRKNPIHLVVDPHQGVDNSNIGHIGLGRGLHPPRALLVRSFENIYCGVVDQVFDSVLNCP